MTAWPDALIRILCSYPLQLLLALHLFSMPTFRRRPLFWLRAILFALPVLLGFELSLTLYPHGLLPDAPFIDRALQLVPTAWFYLMLLCCYVCTAREALFVSACALALQNAVYNIFWIIMKEEGFAEFGLTAMAVTWMLMLLVYSAVLLVFLRWMRDREGHTLPRRRVLQNAVVVVLFVILFNFRVDDSPYRDYVYIAYVFADMLALLMQIGLIRESELTLQNENFEKLLASEQKKQKMSAENVELINRKCHDLKHQLEALKRMPSEEERNRYINEVEKAVLFFESAVKTGNETLDLILMEKQLYCKAHGITLTSVCDGEQLKLLETMDLYALFGNALENAIESVSREAPENRIISFRVGRRDAFLSIHIENYLGHPVELQQGLPVTSKDDRQYHGFGVLSIRHVVEKYHGVMSIRTDQNRFRLDILLPCATQGADARAD